MNAASESDNHSEFLLIRSLVAQTTNNAHSYPLMSPQSRRDSHSRNNFYPGRPVPGNVFFNNVNIFNFSQESFSSNFIFAPLLPVLLSFLQSSGTSPSPLELHPTAFTVSVGCSASYYLAIAAKFMFPGFASQFGALMSVFGSLSAATLISLTLQLPWWSIFFILLFMGGFFMLGNKIHAKYANVSRPPPRTMRPLLPV
ncbi:hypothetical protein K1719_036478 [Acacia pycnantha]|nr:hypothetical protein K1719_036478 [Acacia pycnantha]